MFDSDSPGGAGACLPGPVLHNSSMSISDRAEHQRVATRLANEEKLDPEVEALVTGIIGRVADKWTMIVVDLLAERGELRFSQLQHGIEGISQKVLTHTLRGMEREGLAVRTIHPEVPPRVEYRLTDLGLSLGAAFCGVWVWAEQNRAQIEQARAAFDARAGR